MEPASGTEVGAGAQPRAASSRAFYLALSLFAGGAGLLGYQFIPEAQAHASTRPRVQVEGRTLAADADSAAFALEVARAYLATPLTVDVGPWEFRVTRADLGVRVDLEALRATLSAARDVHSPLLRLHVQEHGDLPLTLRIPARLEGDRALRWFLRIKDQVFQRERDARLDLRTRKVVPEQQGLALDVHGSLDRLTLALLTSATKLEAAVLRTSPKRTREALRAVDVDAVLGSFETRYNTQDNDRSFNLRVAARHVDGIVLLPGDEFDFNRVVGERSEANGFRPAPVIADGELCAIFNTTPPPKQYPMAAMRDASTPGCDFRKSIAA